MPSPPEIREHAARAEHARHGAGQLSLSAQRAPTLADCEDGWRRVAGIVAVAEEAARAAAALAGGHVAAQRAAAAARAARKIVDERNHAYTFHADPGFSFGEGWYVAAAAVLAGVLVQIEPDQPATASAARFLRDAGLGPQLVPYRSRPRANKQTTELIARAFANDPLDAQRRLRRAFLGAEPVPAAIAAWADARLAREGKKVLVWIRRGTHHHGRNSTHAEVVHLVRRARDAGLVPVLFGEAAEEPVAGAADLTLFRLDPLFRGEDLRRAQLMLFEQLRQAHGLVGQVGVTTAGMDGPALLGLPTLYLTESSNVRMRRWVGAVPDYEEVVRGPGSLDCIGETLRRWRGR